MATPFTPQERAQVKRFVELVYEMVGSRFVRDLRHKDHTIKYESLPDGEGRLSAPSYDKEDFRSFLTSFRQVAISSSEEVYFNKIRNIIWKYADAEFREDLKGFKKATNKLLTKDFAGIRVGRMTQHGEETFGGYELLDAYINNVAFHWGSDMEQAANYIKGSEPWEYIWPILATVISPMLESLVWFVNSIQAKAMLDESDFPPAPYPK
jgi:hypothetical protein